VAVTHVNSDFFQRGSMLGEENMNQANLSVAADRMLLPEQVMVLQYLNGISFLYTFHMTL
jgi:hypothetical protein